MNAQIPQPIDLAAGYASGMTITALAKATGRSRGFIRRQLLRLRVQLPERHPPTTMPHAIWNLPPAMRVASVANSHPGVSASYLDRGGLQAHAGPVAAHACVPPVAMHLLGLPVGSRGSIVYHLPGCLRLDLRWQSFPRGVSIVGILGEPSDVMKSLPRYLSRIAGVANAANR